MLPKDNEKPQYLLSQDEIDSLKAIVDANPQAAAQIELAAAGGDPEAIEFMLLSRTNIFVDHTGVDPLHNRVHPASGISVSRKGSSKK